MHCVHFNSKGNRRPQPNAIAWRWLGVACLLFTALGALCGHVRSETIREGWVPSGGNTFRAKGAGKGAQALGVEGSGEDSNYWRNEKIKLDPHRLYAVRFALRGEGAGGCAITGTSSVNRDFTPTKDWEARSFAFFTPADTADTFLRFGQWQWRGKVLYDRIELAQVLVAHLNSGGIELGENEEIRDGRYAFAARLEGFASNFSRPLHANRALFNSNRWCLYDGAEVVYLHQIAKHLQQEASVTVNMNYHQSGRLVVEASADGARWEELGAVPEPASQTFTLPASLFPAEKVFVRLRAEKGASFQVNQYEYNAGLTGSPPNFIGRTLYWQITGETSSVVVDNLRLTDCGAAGPKLSAEVSSTAAAPLRVTATMRVESKTRKSEPHTQKGLLPPGIKSTFEFPLGYAAGETNALILTVCAETFSLFEAKAEVEVCFLDAADYGCSVAGAPADLGLWWCESGWKVGRNRALPEKSSAAVELSAARGEYEAVQVVLRPRKDAVLRSVRAGNLELSAGGGEPGRDLVGGSSSCRPPCAALGNTKSEADPHPDPLPEGEGAPAEPEPIRDKPSRDREGAAEEERNRPVLDAKNVSIREVAYVHIAHSTDALGAPGDFPDPLPILRTPLELKADRNQPLWITVFVPAGTPGGVYAGKISLETDLGSAEVPLEITVYDFDLPRETHVRSGFGIDVGTIEKYHKPQTDEQKRDLWDRYMRNFKEHRICPYNFYAYNDYKVNFEGEGAERKVKLDFERFDEAGKRYLDEFGFNSFVLPVHGMPWGRHPNFHEAEFGGFKQGTAEYDSLWADYIRRLESHLKERGWLERGYVYWFDEPEPVDYGFVVSGQKQLKGAGAGIVRMLTEQPEKELTGHVDLWCPLTPNIDAKTVAERRAAGDEVWWYVCCGPHEPFVGLFIDHPGTELRVWLWQTWQTGVQGILIWTTTWWHNSQAFPNELQDPWKDPMSYSWIEGAKPGTRAFWGNGDGRFFYPPRRDPNTATEFALDDPIPCIRWECLRDGVEDYEYFFLLRTLVEAAKTNTDSKAPASLVRDAEKLLAVPADVSKSMTDFTRDPRPLLQHRARLAEAIQKMRE
ncbi:MAG: DUF4091 domain-containing protein [Planctomycetota bacterium]|nr:DUF4091 domain-containing protein [Planctomycetota bacterium]